MAFAELFRFSMRVCVYAVKGAAYQYSMHASFKVSGVCSITVSLFFACAMYIDSILNLFKSDKVVESVMLV